jgi:hypothetical protein
MLPQAVLQQALVGAPLKALRGPWYRAVNYDHLSGPPPGAPPGAAVQPLWSGGAARHGARFTPRASGTTPGRGGAAIDCLYLAEDELTPLLEVVGMLRPPGSPIPALFEPQVMMTVDGVLTDILDLTDVRIHQLLGTSHQELTGEWVVQQSTYLTGRGTIPPTQLLGAEAFASSRIAGLRYPSSKNTNGIGVVVYASRLVPGRHSLTVFNQPSGSLQQSLP